MFVFVVRTIYIKIENVSILLCNSRYFLIYSSKKEELMKKFQLEESDLLDADKIGLYQFVSRDETKSEVQELKAGELGFETPTFSNAFEKMLEVTYEI